LVERRHDAVLPPLTAMTWPVMNEALAEATNTMASAISSGLPARFSGTPATSPAFLSELPVNRSSIAVSIGQKLWSFETGTQFAGNPMTYAVNGKQYIAPTLGGRPRRDEGSFPEAAEIPQNVMLVVFGL
jgi:hypothetical protein